MENNITPEDIMKLKGKYFSKYDLSNFKHAELEKLARWKNTDEYKIISAYFGKYKKAYILDQMSKVATIDAKLLQAQMIQWKQELKDIKFLIDLPDLAAKKLEGKGGIAEETKNEK
jgi:hypothetical protein